MPISPPAPIIKTSRTRFHALNAQNPNVAANGTSPLTARLHLAALRIITAIVGLIALSTWIAAIGITTLLLTDTGVTHQALTQYAQFIPWLSLG